MTKSYTRKEMAGQISIGKLRAVVKTAGCYALVAGQGQFRWEMKHLGFDPEWWLIQLVRISYSRP